MVIHLSCSSFLVSVNLVSPALAEAMIPALLTSESVRVDLPWSTWAITDMLRMLCLRSMISRIWSTVKFTWKESSRLLYNIQDISTIAVQNIHKWESTILTHRKILQMLYKRSILSSVHKLLHVYNFHAFVYTIHFGQSVWDHDGSKLMWYALVSGDLGWEKVHIKYINKLVGSLFTSYSDKHRWRFTIYMDFNLLHGRRMSNWYTVFYHFDSHIVSFLVHLKLQN